MGSSLEYVTFTGPTPAQYVVLPSASPVLDMFNRCQQFWKVPASTVTAPVVPGELVVSGERPEVSLLKWSGERARPLSFSAIGYSICDRLAAMDTSLTFPIRSRYFN